MNYSNPTQLQAAILDWAGTVVDFGSFAPTQIFVEAFAEFDVQVSIEEARGPMGMGKWDHIRTLCDQPQIAARSRAVFARAPSDDDVTALYNRFMPLQIEKIATHSALIPGALQTISADGNGDTAQRHNIGADALIVHDDEGAENAERQGDDRHQRRAEVKQKQRAHHRHHREFFEQFM